MTSTYNSWIKEFNEASKLADDINGMMLGKSSLPLPGPETVHHFTAIQRHIATLEIWLENLQFLLPRTKSITNKEMNRRKDMLASLRLYAKKLSSSFVTYQSDILVRVNQGIVASQKHIIEEKDKTLDNLGKMLSGMQRTMLVVNEELSLETRLIIPPVQIPVIDEVDSTALVMGGVEKRLDTANKCLEENCSVMSVLLLILGIGIVIVVVMALIKYL